MLGFNPRFKGRKWWSPLHCQPQGNAAEKAIREVASIMDRQSTQSPAQEGAGADSGTWLGERSAGLVWVLAWSRSQYNHFAMGGEGKKKGPRGALATAKKEYAVISYAVSRLLCRREFSCCTSCSCKAKPACVPASDSASSSLPAASSSAPSSPAVASSKRKVLAPSTAINSPNSAPGSPPSRSQRLASSSHSPQKCPASPRSREELCRRLNSSSQSRVTLSRGRPSRPCRLASKSFLPKASRREGRKAAGGRRAQRGRRELPLSSGVTAAPYS
jgi:hypothetical protein